MSPAKPSLQAASQLISVFGRLLLLTPGLGYSQFRDILGDALGQGLEVLVAASDHSVQAGAFLGALWAGQAAPLLLAWGGRRRATSVRGQAFLGTPAARALPWGA